MMECPALLTLGRPTRRRYDPPGSSCPSSASPNGPQPKTPRRRDSALCARNDHAGVDCRVTVTELRSPHLIRGGDVFCTAHPLCRVREPRLLSRGQIGVCIESGAATTVRGLTQECGFARIEEIQGRPLRRPWIPPGEVATRFCQATAPHPGRRWTGSRSTMCAADTARVVAVAASHDCTTNLLRPGTDPTDSSGPSSNGLKRLDERAKRVPAGGQKSAIWHGAGPAARSSRGSLASSPT